MGDKGLGGDTGRFWPKIKRSEINPVNSRLFTDNYGGSSSCRIEAKYISLHFR